MSNSKHHLQHPYRHDSQKSLNGQSNHGGGTVAYDGSGVIPAGALKSGYNGPCPPSGSHRYEFTVKAVYAAGVIVGQGKQTQSFP